MGKYVVAGGKRLDGEANIHGAKNAVLPILAAAVLTGAQSVIRNCPDISDTRCSIKILRHLGCSVDYDGSTLVVNSAGVNKTTLPCEAVSKMRSSIIFAGALLGRFGEVDSAFPGGCLLGDRPIDLHLQGFRKMGVAFEDSPDRITGKANKLQGTRIDLTFPSVGATQNIMLAGVLAEGTTIITGAAKEPEIVDLQGFLRSAGANVSGAGTSTIVIDGVKSLRPAQYTIMPDRIVAGTYLAAGAITHGYIRLNNINRLDIYPATRVLADMGVDLWSEGSALVLKADKNLSPVPLLKTKPHPGFPTDLQAQFTALLATVKGRSVVEENLFEARHAHIAELAKMGADIKVEGDSRFIINGVSRLHGAEVAAKDLRGGAALILAGLSAEGITTVGNACYVQRGYVDIVADIQSLGGDIKFISSE
ncbi:MAG: UDP-N-acetylglucosamine 1-carboxyvinyltransferase [Defluviitaleaceae bacterium]|nr:UDP-N-acetylglucosamine 1-carboxyvinyltransferase [Defluviitaleaceae bacterium]